MNGSSVVAARYAVPGRRQFADYVDLTRPRIGLMVLVTVSVSLFLASWGQPHPRIALCALLGTGCVAASASVWNQWLERDVDARMSRTRRRSLPSGRVASREALWLGSWLLLFGLAVLAIGGSWLSAAIAACTWLSYVWVYTPMKRRSSWNTLVGAVPGALPVWIGWTAASVPIDVRACAVMAVVFFWQFPHFMAIAWRYRDDYAAGRLKMLTVVDPSGRRAGLQAVMGATALLPVSMIPAWLAPPSGLISAILFGLSMWFLVRAFAFWRRPCDRSATRLLRGSLIYLPAVMAAYCLLPWLT